MDKKIIKTSYTWKIEYTLPFESKWSIMAKFCFLNGFSWDYVKTTPSIKKMLYSNSLIKPFYIYAPTFKEHKFQKEKVDAHCIDLNYNISKFCPKCMKYGYHSVLHEIDGFNYCFLHDEPLISISKENLFNSNLGTYDFFAVKVENIINNSDLSIKVEQYIQKRNEKKIVSTDYFFFNYREKDGSRRCYDSTEKLYQKLFFMQEQVRASRNKCIFTIPIDKIDDVNKKLFEYIIFFYVSNIMEKESIYVTIKNDDFVENYNSCKRIFLQNASNNKYEIKEDSLAWCFIAVVSEKINENFNGLKEWYDMFFVFNSIDFLINKKSKNVEQFLIILVCQAITGSYDPNTIMRYNSKHWTKWDTLVSFGLPIYNELGYFGKYISSNKGPSRATQYILYPIIKDLFNELLQQAKLLLENDTISLNRDSLNHLKADVWKAPQYNVFYYQDRVEVYRCEPD